MINKNDDTPDPTQNHADRKALFDGFLNAPANRLKSGLYLIATPIGNLRDITVRALDVLAMADCVACEDTRVSGKLMQLLGIKKKLLPYHDHNADTQRPHILEKIKQGQIVALISDAGMPLISDPGYKLVRDCIEQKIYVTSLPGANAPLMALQLSGLPSDHFSFLGFLPNKTKARKDVLSKWKDVSSTLIIFESASRLESCCRDMMGVLGDRQMALTRELTKKFEDIWVGKISEIINRLEQEGPPKGEIVLVVDRGEEKLSTINLDEMIQSALEKYTIKEASIQIATQTGIAKKQIYNRALQLKDQK